MLLRSAKVAKRASVKGHESRLTPEQSQFPAPTEASGKNVDWWRKQESRDHPVPERETLPLTLGDQFMLGREAPPPLGDQYMGGRKNWGQPVVSPKCLRGSQLLFLPLTELILSSPKRRCFPEVKVLMSTSCLSLQL